MPFQFTDQQVSNYHKSTFGLLDYLQEVLGNKFFAGTQSILDVGCGDGKIAACIAKNSPSSTVIGCDVSQAMISFASKQYPSNEYPNLQFLEKDAYNLDFDNDFDRLISFNCLHWMKNQKLVLHKLYSSLKTGGKAFMVVTTKSSDDDLQTICRKVIFSFKWLPRFLNFKTEHSFHTKKEYEQLLKEANFSIDTIEQKKREVVFNSREEFEALLTSVLTPLYHLPETKRPVFLDEIFAQFIKKGKVDSNGAIRFYISQIEMLVSKNSH